MSHDRRRVLIAVNKTHDGEMKSLFEREPLAGWQPLFADSFSRARFTMRHNPCDALIVHEDLLDAEGPQGLAWLAWKKDYPTVFVGQSAMAFQRAFELGASQCLPLDMALSNPPLLAMILQQAQKHLQTSAELHRTKHQLAQARRHIDRLVTLMWRTTPHQDDCQWYSEPFMLERLSEELARADRHKIPLSLAVGELSDEEREDAILPDWTPELLIKEKRRCDVVGQYGPRGFLILMVHTPKTGGFNCLKRLQDRLEQPEQNQPRPAIRAYFGLTSTHGERLTPQGLLRSAEENLEAARREKLLRIVAD